MKRVLFLTIYIFISLITGIESFAETPVNGNITANTTWTLANSPYIVTGTIQVYPEATLTIEPGVEIRFNKESGFKIGGGLVAIADANKMIKLTSNQQITVTQDRWGGLEFLDSTFNATVDNDLNYVAGNILKYCIIENSGYPQGVIWCENSNVYLSNNNFQFNSSGLHFSEGDNVVIKDNIITENEVFGLNLITGGYFLNNQLINNEYVNFSFNSSQRIFVEGNLIKENNDIYFLFQNSEVNMIHNIIDSNNRISGLFNVMQANLNLKYCSITNNSSANAGDGNQRTLFANVQGLHSIEYCNIYGNTYDYLILNIIAQVT